MSSMKIWRKKLGPHVGMMYSMWWESSTQELERTTHEEKGSITAVSERLSRICVENNLVTGGTLFKHRTIHKTSRRSPDGNTVSQIGHVIINQKWR